MEQDTALDLTVRNTIETLDRKIPFDEINQETDALSNAFNEYLKDPKKRKIDELTKSYQKMGLFLRKLRETHSYGVENAPDFCIEIIQKAIRIQKTAIAIGMNCLEEFSTSYRSDTAECAFELISEILLRLKDLWEHYANIFFIRLYKNQPDSALQLLDEVDEFLTNCEPELSKNIQKKSAFQEINIHIINIFKLYHAKITREKLLANKHKDDSQQITKCDQQFKEQIAEINKIRSSIMDNKVSASIVNTKIKTLLKPIKIVFLNNEPCFTPSPHPVYVHWRGQEHLYYPVETSGKCNSALPANMSLLFKAVRTDGKCLISEAIMSEPVWQIITNDVDLSCNIEADCKALPAKTPLLPALTQIDSATTKLATTDSNKATQTIRELMNEILKSEAIERANPDELEAIFSHTADFTYKFISRALQEKAISVAFQHTVVAMLFAYLGGINKEINKKLANTPEDSNNINQPKVANRTMILNLLESFLNYIRLYWNTPEPTDNTTTNIATAAAEKPPEQAKTESTTKKKKKKKKKKKSARQQKGASTEKDVEAENCSPKQSPVCEDPCDDKAPAEETLREIVTEPPKSGIPEVNTAQSTLDAKPTKDEETEDGAIIESLERKSPKLEIKTATTPTKKKKRKNPATETKMEQKKEPKIEPYKEAEKEVVQQTEKKQQSSATTIKPLETRTTKATEVKNIEPENKEKKEGETPAPKSGPKPISQEPKAKENPLKPNAQSFTPTQFKGPDNQLCINYINLFIANFLQQFPAIEYFMRTFDIALFGGAIPIIVRANLENSQLFIPGIKSTPQYRAGNYRMPSDLDFIYHGNLEELAARIPEPKELSHDKKTLYCCIGKTLVNISSYDTTIEEKISTADFNLASFAYDLKRKLICPNDYEAKNLYDGLLTANKDPVEIFTNKPQSVMRLFKYKERATKINTNLTPFLRAENPQQKHSNAHPLSPKSIFFALDQFLFLGNGAENYYNLSATGIFKIFFSFVQDSDSSPKKLEVISFLEKQKQPNLLLYRTLQYIDMQISIYSNHKNFNPVDFRTSVKKQNLFILFCLALFSAVFAKDLVAKKNVLNREEYSREVHRCLQGLKDVIVLPLPKSKIDRFNTELSSCIAAITGVTNIQKTVVTEFREIGLQMAATQAPLVYPQSIARHYTF